MVAEAGVWGTVSQKEDGWAKRRDGLGKEPWGVPTLKEPRRRQRRGQPGEGGTALLAGPGSHTRCEEQQTWED